MPAGSERIRGFCPEPRVEASFQVARLNSIAIESTGRWGTVNWSSRVADVGELLEFACGSTNWSLSSSTHVYTVLWNGV